MRLILASLLTLFLLPAPATAIDINPAKWLDQCLMDTPPNARQSHKKPSCLSLVLWLCEHGPAPNTCLVDIKTHARDRAASIATDLPKTHPEPRLDATFQQRLSQLIDPAKILPCDTATTDRRRRLCEVKQALSQYSLALFLQDFTTRIEAP